MFKVRDYKKRGEVHGLEVDIRLRMPDGTVHRERRRAPTASKLATRKWAIARERELIINGLRATKSTEQYPSPRYAPFLEDAQHLYLVEVSGTCVKVGVTHKPLDRIAAHQKSARDHGRTIGRVWVSIAHREALDNERRLKGESRSEYLRDTKFERVLDQALMLSYTR